MDCEEERKLYKLKMDAEKEFKLVSLLAATEPLGVETPQGHSFSKERRDKINKTEEELNAIRKTYQNHIKNCPICGRVRLV